MNPHIGNVLATLELHGRTQVLAFAKRHGPAG